MREGADSWADGGADHATIIVVTIVASGRALMRSVMAASEYRRTVRNFVASVPSLCRFFARVGAFFVRPIRGPRGTVAAAQRAIIRGFTGCHADWKESDCGRADRLG